MYERYPTPAVVVFLLLSGGALAGRSQANGTSTQSTTACACGAESPDECGDPATVQKAGKKVVVEVNWCRVVCLKEKARAKNEQSPGTESTAAVETIDLDQESSAEGTIIKGRVTEDDTVVVRVKNFNFVNYSLKYGFEVTVVEAYATLDQLFRQATSFFPSGAELELPERDPLVTWYQTIEDKRETLAKFLAKYAQRIGLCEDEINDIRKEANTVASTIAELESKRQSARASLTATNLPLYETIKQSHNQLVGLLARFRFDALRTASGDEIEVNTENAGVNPRKAGSYVTLTMAPTDKEGNTQSSSYSLTYFVHSKLPVIFHIGLAVTNVDSIEFETVRALATSDLFSEVRTQDNIRDFSAFLSFEFISWSEFLDGGGVSVTLGTSLNDIGSTVHAGASVRLFKRFLVTVGGTSQKVQEGQNPIVEQIADLTETRTLFDSVANRRDWGFFTGISFSVF